MTAKKSTVFCPVIFDLFSPFVFDSIHQSPLWEDATFHYNRVNVTSSMQYAYTQVLT